MFTQLRLFVNTRCVYSTELRGSFCSRMLRQISHLFTYTDYWRLSNCKPGECSSVTHRSFTTKKLFSTTQNKHCLIAMQTYKECFTFLYANHWQGLSVQETKHHFRRVRRFFAIRGSLVGWCMNISQPRRKVFAECVNLCIHWHWNFFYCSEITIWIVWRRCLMWQSKQDFLALST